jgi:hypothetical protein
MVGPTTVGPATKGMTMTMVGPTTVGPATKGMTMTMVGLTTVGPATKGMTMDHMMSIPTTIGPTTKGRCDRFDQSRCGTTEAWAMRQGTKSTDESLI